MDLEIVSMTSTFASIVDTTETTVSVSITIRNNGSETITNDFTVEFYISNNGTLNTADTSVGTLSVTEDILPGKIGYSTLTSDTTIAAGTTGGFYTMFAILDSTDAVEEMDESNNKPANANNCSIFIAVDDGAADISARLLFCYPDGAVNDSNGYYPNYGLWEDIDTPVWDDSNEDIDSDVDYVSGGESGPEVLGVSNSFNVAQATSLGVRTNAYSYRTKLVWRLVPSYVTSIETQYIPNVLNSDDAFEANDSIAAATDLSGAAHPLCSWVNSYNTDYNDYTSYTFDS